MFSFFHFQLRIAMFALFGLSIFIVSGNYGLLIQLTLYKQRANFMNWKLNKHYTKQLFKCYLNSAYSKAEKCEPGTSLDEKKQG